MGYEVNSILVGRRPHRLPDSGVAGWLRRMASAVEHRDAREYDRFAAELGKLGWTLTRADSSGCDRGEPESADGP